MTRLIAANDDPATVRVFVIRHGKTDWNAKKILQGHIDIDMNDEGKEQAQKLGHHFKDIKLDLVLSSDLVRCTGTADEIRKYQPDVPYKTSANLRERDMGEVQGMSISAALAKYGADYKNMGEKNPELVARVSEAYDEFLQQAVKNNFKNVVLCTHGGVIRSFTKHLHGLRKYSLGASLSSLELLVPFNTSVTVIDYNKSSGGGQISVFGVTEHLDDKVHMANQQAL